MRIVVEISAARKIAGHQARLDNMDRSRLGEERKEVLDIRKAYTRRALGLYIDLQQAALA